MITKSSLRYWRKWKTFIFLSAPKTADRQQRRLNSKLNGKLLCLLENARSEVAMGVTFTSGWWRGCDEFSIPIAERRKEKDNSSKITFYTWYWISLTIDMSSKEICHPARRYLGCCSHCITRLIWILLYSRTVKGSFQVALSLLFHV